MPHRENSNSNADQARKKPKQISEETPLLKERVRDETKASGAEEHVNNQKDRNGPAKMQTVVAIFQVIIAFFMLGTTIAYVYIAHCQWAEMSNAVVVAQRSYTSNKESMTTTLAEMHGQTVAMQRLARANEVAANLTKQSMQGTLRQMKDETASMQRAAKANEYTAAVAKKSLEAAQDQARLDQRAWIGVVETGATQAEVGKPAGTTLIFANTGHTPARNVRVACHAESTTRDREPNYKLAKLAYTSKESIMPGRAVYCPLNLFSGDDILSASVHDAIQQGRLRVFLYGTIYYDDVFKQHHSTEFCLQLSRNLTDWDIYRDHNSETDDK